MRDGVVLLDGKETGDQFCAFTKRAGSIDIISPFITTRGVEKRLTALKGRKKVDVKILTRAHPVDVLSDAVSVDTLKRLADLASADGEGRFEICRHERVHAKLSSDHLVFDTGEAPRPLRQARTALRAMTRRRYGSTRPLAHPAAVI